MFKRSLCVKAERRNGDPDTSYESAEMIGTIESLGAISVILPRRHWK